MPSLDLKQFWFLLNLPDLYALKTTHDKPASVRQPFYPVVDKLYEVSIALVAFLIHLPYNSNNWGQSNII